MPDLDFEVEGADAMKFAATPHIAFALRIANSGPEPIHSVILRCQIQLEVTRRRYTGNEQKRFVDFWGEPSQWAQTLHGMLWANASLVVPGFSGSAGVNLPIPCTFDFNVAATKYFSGLEGGEVPLSFLFSGTVFYADKTGTLQVTQIPWEKEATYRMPVAIWKRMMDDYYPNTAWLCLHRDAFDRLHAYKVEHGIPTFEQTIEAVIRED